MEGSDTDYSDKRGLGGGVVTGPSLKFALNPSRVF